MLKFPPESPCVEHKQFRTQRTELKVVWQHGMETDTPETVKRRRIYVYKERNVEGCGLVKWTGK